MDNEIVKNRVQLRAKAKREASLKFYNEQQALSHGICPDCAGDVKDITPFFAKIISSERTLKCNECGKTHTKYNWD